MTRVTMLIGCVATSLIGMSACQTEADKPSVSSNHHVHVRMMEGLTIRDSSTASAWVTHSDAVVVLTVMGEAEIDGRPSSAQGSGGQLVGRAITANVDKVIWLRPGLAADAAPAEMTMSVVGWFRSGEDPKSPAKAAREGGSRLEPGHTYVAAIATRPSDCEFDGPETGETHTAIGAEAVLPFDDSTLGLGEFEGRSVRPDEFAEVVRQPSLRGELVSTNATLSDLERILSQTTPTQPHVAKNRYSDFGCV